MGLSSDDVRGAIHELRSTASATTAQAIAQHLGVDIAAVEGTLHDMVKRGELGEVVSYSLKSDQNWSV